MKPPRLPLAIALAGVLIITGCSQGGSPTKDATGEECLAPGTQSDSVTVSGETGDDLEITSKLPLKTKDMQRTVLSDGKGDVVEDGETISVAMSAFNGRDGSEIEKSPATPAPYSAESYTGWLGEALRCATEGQQVTVVAPYSEVFGDVAPDELPVDGIEKDDSFVFVLEFGEISEGSGDAAPSEPGTIELDELLEKAEGKAVPAPDGFPTVKLEADGSPNITMPKGVKPPEKLEIATLIEGDGETVEPGDRVYVNYRGVIWSTGEEFDSSWSRGEPANFLTTQVIGGFQEALEGQKVGSQVISVVPADDGGYGADNLQQMGHEPDDVMVFVLDILGTVHADSK